MRGQNYKSALIMVIHNHVPEAKTLFCAIEEVDYIIIVDNSDTESCLMKIEALLESTPSKYYFIRSGGNLGLSKGLNLGIERAMKLGAYWIHFLDHDAVVPTHFFNNILNSWEELSHKHKNLGIVVPLVTDKDDMKFYPRKNYKSINSSITSGILTNIDVLTAVGHFDESLFVELVDIEFTMRVKNHGYTIQRVNNLLIVQEFGDKIDFNLKLVKTMFELVQSVNLIVSKRNAFGFYKSGYADDRRKDFYFLYGHFLLKEKNLVLRSLRSLHFLSLGLLDSLMYLNFKYFKWCIDAVSGN